MSTPVDSFIEVRLPTQEDFLKVKETLTRVGVHVPNAPRRQLLEQVCYILHKQGRYFIVHHKELRRLDGEPVEMSAEDVARRNRIASLLAEWHLVEIAKPESIVPVAEMSQVKVIPFRDKLLWELSSPYRIGVGRHPPAKS